MSALDELIDYRDRADAAERELRQIKIRLASTIIVSGEIPLLACAEMDRLELALNDGLVLLSYSIHDGLSHFALVESEKPFRDVTDAVLRELVSDEMLLKYTDSLPSMCCMP